MHVFAYKFTFSQYYCDIRRKIAILLKKLLIFKQNTIFKKSLFMNKYRIESILLMTYINTRKINSIYRELLYELRCY